MCALGAAGARQCQFVYGQANTAPDKGDGSKLWEVNQWLWRFARGMPRSTSVADAQAARGAAKANSRAKAWTTRRRNVEASQEAAQ